VRWFVQAFSPDSEGQWVNDSHTFGKGSEAEALARRAKNALKVSGAFFSPEWVEKACAQLRGLCRWADVVVADLGGLPSAQNRQIVLAGEGEAFPIVLTRDGDDGGWRAWWEELFPPRYVGPYREDLAQEILGEVLAAISR
jgi:hypothetical protein